MSVRLLGVAHLIRVAACATRLYLRGADLRGADLRGANLSEADLSRSDLRGADLSDADLSRADLTGADLTGANLTGANLTGANLTGADLTGANISGTDISGADISGADISGADITGARGLPRAPSVRDLDGQIAARITADPARLNMANWHCGTAHCRAGHAVDLAGEAGADLERALGTCVAGALIYHASTGRVPDFFASDDAARADILRCAGCALSGTPMYQGEG